MKGPSATFNIMLKGVDVYPEAVPWRKVFDAVRAVSGLSRSGDADAEQESLSLIGVRRGSAVFQCYAPDEESALENLRRIGEMLEKGTLPDDAALRLRPLQELSRIAKALNCQVYLVRDRKDVLAKILPDSYDRLATNLLISDETTIVGEVKRVGGVKELRCSIRLPDRQPLLYCDVASADVARQLGIHLYESVMVSGRATWIRTTFDLVSFSIQSVRERPASGLTDAFRELRRAGGDAWDDVEDPGDLLRRIRG